MNSPRSWVVSRLFQFPGLKPLILSVITIFIINANIRCNVGTQSFTEMYINLEVQWQATLRWWERTSKRTLSKHFSSFANVSRTASHSQNVIVQAILKFPSLIILLCRH